MKESILAALLSIATATAYAENPTDRYVVVTHSVHVNRTGRALPVMFKVDSVSGTIWRIAGNAFIQIPVEMALTATIVENQEGYVEAKREREVFRERLRQIIIPEVDFRQADVRDVLAFLHKASVEHDPEQRGIGIIMTIDDHPHRDDSSQVMEADPFAVSSRGGESHGPLISFRSMELSLLDALDIVADIAKLRWRHSGGAVLVSPYYDEGKHATRMYELLPSTMDRIHHFHPALMEPGPTDDAPYDQWRDFFSQYGVSWPRRSSIKPIPLIGRLLVTNTIDNLRIIEGVIEAINTYPAQGGRFQLISDQGEGQQMLILLDSQIGHTWWYVVTEYDLESNRIQSDMFSYIAH